jgi:arylformamidase
VRGERERQRALVELSHVIEDGLVTYPGLPAPVIRDHLSRRESRERYAGQAEFHIAHLELVSNTGTYVDAPFHRFADGEDVAGLDLGRVADLDGVVVSVAPEARSGGRAIGPAAFEGIEIGGRAVLIHTGWAARWGTPAYFEGHPFLDAPAAVRLAEAGAALVGIDALNIDDIADPRRPVHTTLLGAGIPVVEHLCGLESLVGRRFRFFAVPAPVRGCGSFPVRAFAVVEEARA